MEEGERFKEGDDSGTSGDDGGSGGLLRLLAVGDFVGVALEIFRGPRSGPVCAADIFSHHVVSYKDRASGAEGSAEVCGLFKCGTDLIFECNEMTTLTHGSLQDIGSATA